MVEKLSQTHDFRRNLVAIVHSLSDSTIIIVLDFIINIKGARNNSEFDSPYVSTLETRNLKCGISIRMVLIIRMMININLYCFSREY